MRLLQRLLRFPHKRRSRHRDPCPDCQLQKRRERQYLERLRGADVPVASSDLTARLLARTAELASAEQPDRRPPSTVLGSRPVLRASAIAAGSAAAAAALLGGSAYLMGADPAQRPGVAPATAFFQQDPAGFGADAMDGLSGAPAGWSLTGEPDFTPAGSLSTAQLTMLRSEGWSCPVLRELGYHLIWARGRVLTGGDVVELRLTDGRHFTTILEQHGAPDRQRGPAGQSGFPETAPPLNPLTGHPAPLDGFTSAVLPPGNAAAGAEPGVGASQGSLWVNHAAPFAAIYKADQTTFTYVSDQPAERTGEAVTALVQARTLALGTAAGQGQEPQGTIHGPATADGSGPDSGPGHDFSSRMERGMGRILELLAP
ncbi:hypothetical protein [Arthrobacter sp. H16F315]|uniref:hypothetical protein n=1 Tax=Arthrobacter sp. H16F315 TaxID=2955314 RepID=UPI00209730C4|nr:hypothetical protein [Arthrobacter sp. H16F315]MDD1476965.1 hypothetical protein [Arthrobacter sp. H16F315]